MAASPTKRALAFRTRSTVTDSPVATATAFPNYSVLTMTNHQNYESQNIGLENFGQLSRIEKTVKAVKLGSRKEDKPCGGFERA
jgi:hypothetical protein